MKKSKNDAIFNIQSECLMIGSDILIHHLINMVKAFAVHGVVPPFLLVCTLLPLVKDNLSDITSSDNYP